MLKAMVHVLREGVMFIFNEVPCRRGVAFTYIWKFGLTIYFYLLWEELSDNLNYVFSCFIINRVLINWWELFRFILSYNRFHEDLSKIFRRCGAAADWKGCQLKRDRREPWSSSCSMQVIISLNYEKMNECRLVFNGKPLLDKTKNLRDIMDPNGINEVVVTPKSELEAYA